MEVYPRNASSFIRASYRCLVTVTILYHMWSIFVNYESTNFYPDNQYHVYHVFRHLCLYMSLCLIMYYLGIAMYIMFHHGYNQVLSYLLYDLPIMPVNMCIVSIVRNSNCLVYSDVLNKYYFYSLIDSIYSGGVFHFKVPQFLFPRLSLILPPFPPCSLPH